LDTFITKLNGVYRTQCPSHRALETVSFGTGGYTIDWTRRQVRQNKSWWG